MKKRLLAILALLVALTLVVLTGCEKKVERKGSDDDKTTKAEATDEVKDENEGKEDTDEESEAVGEESPEDGKDKPSKPSSGDKDTVVVEPFDDPNKEENVAQDYVEDIVDSGVEVESDEDILKSNEYIVAMRQIEADGTVTTMKLARKGDNIAMVMDSPEENMSIIITKDVLYFIIPEEKAYMPLPTELMGDAIDELYAGFDEALELDFEEDAAKTYTETIGGVEYTVKEDENGLKKYCIGDKVVMGQTESGAMMYIDELTGDVPDSEFEVPSGYRQMTMDEFQQIMA